jgi:hypothetical protein
VIFHGYVRATRDSDLLVPDGEEADEAILRFLELTGGRRLSDGRKLTINDIAGVEQLRVNSRRGIIDIIRGGSPPLDFDTVSDRADTVEWEGQTVRVAALPSVVGFKRLAGDDKIKSIWKSWRRFTAACPWSRFPASIHNH